MKLISTIFLFQLVYSRMKMNLDDLTNRIPVEELQSIREKYCQSIESPGKNSDFCSPSNADLPEIPDWLPPGFLLLILSIVRESDELCDIYYEEFHGITDLSLVNNSYIAAGGQGMVFKCECAKEGIEPAVTAQKGKSWPDLACHACHFYAFGGIS